MFTGIIEQPGVLDSLEHGEKVAKIRIASELFSEVKAGDSVAVNGTCLTVLEYDDHSALFEMGPETLKKTTLGNLQKGQIVNLELPMRLMDRLGGHFVQGHVDGMAPVVSVKEEGNTKWIELELTAEAEPFVIEKGSIALDGVSLTVAKKDGRKIGVMLMDYTLNKTNLRDKQVGDLVNFEIDMLAKYASQLMGTSYEK